MLFPGERTRLVRIDGEENFDEVKEIYRRLSMELVELAELKHPDREYGELLEVLKSK